MLFGDDGDDVIIARGGNDTVYGGNGRDMLDGGGGNDQLFGEDGGIPNAAEDGPGGYEVLMGGTGDDVLDGGLGGDMLDGGMGDDRYVFNPGWAQDKVIENVDPMQSQAGADDLQDVLDFVAVRNDLSFDILPGRIVVSDPIGNTVTYVAAMPPALEVESILGGPGADLYTIIGQATHGMFLNGGRGSDTYLVTDTVPQQVPLDPVAGEIFITDVGDIWNIDSLVIEGTRIVDTLALSRTAAKLNAKTIRYSSPGGDGGIDVIDLFGRAGDDLFYLESTPPGIPVGVTGNEGSDEFSLGVHIAETRFTDLTVIAVDTEDNSTVGDLVDDIQAVVDQTLFDEGYPLQVLTVAVNETTMEVEFSVNADVGTIIAVAPGQLPIAYDGNFRLAEDFVFDLTIDPDALVPFATGKTLDRLDGETPDDPVRIIGGDAADPGVDVLNAYDTADGTSDTGALERDMDGFLRIKGLDLPVDQLLDEIEDIGRFGDAANPGITLGRGDDTFTVHTTNRNLLVEGDLVERFTRVNGGDGDDTIDVIEINGTTRIEGGRDDDDLLVNVAESLDVNIHADLTLDGEHGGDFNLVNLVGAGDAGNPVINVYDSGDAGSGSDMLEINGTIENDQFLLRAFDNGDRAAGYGFVTLIHDPDGPGLTYERVNYQNNAMVGLNGGVTVNALGGDDHFAVDGTPAAMFLNGSAGNDTFQIGQMFNSRRVSTGPNASVAPGDEFKTTQTTRGFLSEGATENLVAEGGVGEDRFIVFRNTAAIALNGGPDDDTFIVRAFISIEPIPGAPQEDATINGGEGADRIEYVINAPVIIDGGDGFDTVIIIGTEADDEFVVTEDGVFGAGLNVQFSNVEPASRPTRAVASRLPLSTTMTSVSSSGCAARSASTKGSESSSSSAGISTKMGRSSSFMT